MYLAMVKEKRTDAKSSMAEIDSYEFFLHLKIRHDHNLEKFVILINISFIEKKSIF